MKTYRNFNLDSKFGKFAYSLHEECFVCLLPDPYRGQVLLSHTTDKQRAVKSVLLKPWGILSLLLKKERTFIFIFTYLYNTPVADLGGLQVVFGPFCFLFLTLNLSVSADVSGA